MTNESFFALMIGGMIALLFGSVLMLGGYRFFLVLLPIWGFFFGFGLGAESVQALFGDAFLSTVTSWVVGFVVALVFAILSYLFYFAAVAIIGGALGYAFAVGLLQAIGLDFGLIVWAVGIVTGLVVGAAVLMLNIQKWVVIAATSLLGAAVIVGTFVFMFGGPAVQVVANPVRMALQASPLWAFLFIVLAVIGVIAQFQTTRRFEVETYSRVDELTGPEPTAAGATASTSTGNL